MPNSWLLVGLGCAYITRTEFRDVWDEDGDGWADDEDCEPLDRDYFPYAPDKRGDGCDHDCGTELDEDGDDWPAAADCDDHDPTMFPCSPLEVDGDEVDSDCGAGDAPRTDPCPGLDPDYPPETTIPSCEETPPGEGDADADADSDTDGDSDADSDSDTDTTQPADPLEVTGVWSGACNGIYGLTLDLFEQQNLVSGTLFIDNVGTTYPSIYPEYVLEGSRTVATVLLDVLLPEGTTAATFELVTTGYSMVGQILYVDPSMPTLNCAFSR